MIRNRALSTSILLCLLAAGASAGTRYVNAALGSGTNDGSSWANAFQGSNGLQAALALAVAGDQIWVAQGSYEPTAGATRSIYFLLRNGAAIYGAFAGTEIALEERDWAAPVTVLTGDLNAPDQSAVTSDHPYHAARPPVTD